MADLAPVIGVTIDSTGARKGASDVLTQMNRIASGAKSAQAANDNLSGSFDRTSNAATKLGQQVGNTTSQFDKLNNVVKAFVGIAAVKYVADLADTFTRFTNSLKVANVEAASQTFIIDKLFASSQKYGVQLEAMGALYSKAVQAQSSLNASQGQLLKFTDGVAAALKVQGGSATSAAGALHQLGQAITGNKIQAEEYNSILDGAFPILQAVAAGSDRFKGSVANLTREVKAGNVTSKEFFEAFLKGSTVLEEKAAKSAFTLSSSYQVLSNAMTRYVGESDQANGVSATIGGAMRSLGANLNVVVPAVTTLGVALGVGYVVRAVAASAATSGMALSLTGLTVAARGASVALLGVFGGPIGIAITGTAVLLASFASTSSNVTAALQGTAAASEQLGVKLGDATKAALSANTETAGVGSSAAGSEPKIWSFSHAVGGLTEKLWEQAKAARAARLEMLESQLTQQRTRSETGRAATWNGSRQDSRDSWKALSEGDVIRSVQLGWRSVVSDVSNGLSGGRTGREGQAVVNQGQKVISALEREIANLRTKPISNKDLPVGGGGGAPVNKPAGGGGSSGAASSAATAAEQLAKQIEQFWKSLDGQGADAEALLSTLRQASAEGRNLFATSEQYSKQLELQAIAGRALTKEEQDRATAAVQKTNAAKFYTDLIMRSSERSLELANQEALLKLRESGASEEQLATEKAVLDLRSSALKAGVDLTSEALKANEAALRVDLAREQAIGRQNAKLDEQAEKQRANIEAAASFAKDALANRRPRTFDEAKLRLEDQKKTMLKGLDEALKMGKISGEEFAAGVERATDDFRIGMAEVGDALQFKLRQVGGFLDRVGNFIGGKLGRGIGKLGNAADAFGSFDANRESFGSEFKNLFKGGKDSKLVQGLGDAFGNAMAGLKIGESIADLGKMLGANKGFQTGAKIGGTLGGLTGNPIIAAGASVIGGLLGGVLYKPKYGTAQLTGAGDPVITGRGSKQKAAAKGAAGSVQSELANIAAELGGQIGNYMVSIGTYKDKWRVSTSGSTGKLKTSRGAIDFGDDQGAAIAFAVEDAIKDGAITGLTDIVQKALAGLGTDSAIQFAKDWNAVMDDFKALTDPLGAAIESVNKPLDALKKTMLSIGASSADLAKLEEYRSIKMKAVLEEQTSGFRDLLKNLNGDGGGVTALTQLTRNMSEFEKFRADIAAGKTVDQGKFTDLANSILSGANSVYGTNTKDFQNIVSMLKDATNGAIGLVEAQFNPATAAQAQIAATQAQTDAVVANSNITNDYLGQILVTLQGGGLGNVTGVYRGEYYGGAPNGRLVNAY